MKKIAVLMSTYNGEKYIKEQIDSIMNQNDVRIELYIRDDGSKDKTIDIVKEIMRDYNNIHFYKGQNMKSCKSFLNLMYQDIDADYYSFADQDDYWDKDKLINALNFMENNPRYDPNIPTMYHSNLKIVNDKLEFCRMSHSKPHIPKNKYSSLVENLATGCTIVYNKAANDLLKKHKIDDFTMHDAFVFMVCAQFGITMYDNNAYISYRQHENNVIGASKKRYDFFVIIERLKRIFNRDLQPRYKSAIIFYNAFNEILNGTQKKELLKIVNYKKGIFKRLELFFDFKLVPGYSLNAKIRFKILIILGLI